MSDMSRPLPDGTFEAVLDVTVVGCRLVNPALLRNEIAAVRVLINGSPIAAAVSPRWQSSEQRQPTSFEDRPEGIARDRWDVAIETLDDTVLVECGAIRERISQELARKIFDAVRQSLNLR